MKTKVQNNSLVLMVQSCVVASNVYRIFANGHNISNDGSFVTVMHLVQLQPQLLSGFTTSSLPTIK